MVGEDRSQWDVTLEGTDKAAVRAAVWTSTDGYISTRVPHAAALDVGGFIDTMDGPVHRRDERRGRWSGGLVAVGSVCAADPVAGSVPCAPMAWTSMDGISWERAAAMQAADHQAVVGAVSTGVAASDTGTSLLAATGC